MSLQLHVVAGDELPIYRQIMRQIIDGIACGRLQSGEQLPSHRELAEQLVISPLTVKKAYDELEREGIILTRRGRGTFVAATATTLDRSQQLERLRGLARRLISRAHLARLSLSELIALLEETDAELRAQRASHASSQQPAGLGPQGDSS